MPINLKLILSSNYLQVLKKTAKQVMTTEVSPNDLEYDLTPLQNSVADLIADVTSMPRATTPALIPVGDG